MSSAGCRSRFTFMPARLNLPGVNDSPAPARTLPAPGHRRWLAMSAVVVLLALTAALAWQLWRAADKPPQADRYGPAGGETTPAGRSRADAPRRSSPPDPGQTVAAAPAAPPSSQPPATDRTTNGTAPIRGAAVTAGESPPGAAPVPGRPAGDMPAPAGGHAGDIVFDARLHEDPPATADSPEIHRMWLERIRELRDAGDLQAARESLREYRRRHPDQPLPADLAGLLSE